MVRIVLVPGMGCTPTMECNWYRNFYESFLSIENVTIEAPDFPDPNRCRQSVWIPYLKNNLKVDQNTILVGHSTGSVAILRLLEDTKVLGAVLVAGYHTDLGDKYEAASEYFSKPWDWDKIRNNANWIGQFHSTDDHLVPVAEARFVAENAKAEYFEMHNRNHFMEDEFPELVKYVKDKIKL